jgi:uncharacterized Fe-S center protein
MNKAKSKVYFTGVKEKEDIPSVSAKLRKLIKETSLLDCIKKGDRVAIKLHFGEKGNTGYVPPDYLGVISEEINLKQASPFLSDSNTLYKGSRTNSAEHLQIAYEHGFTPEKVKAQVIIPDDTRKDNVHSVPITGRFIRLAKIVRIFWDADALIGVAHFKGHIMTGFGGALKNIGMGCATRQGKMTQHSDISPLVIKNKCTGCAECELVCPVKAITIVDDKSCIDSSKCIGCANCIAACRFFAIEVPWESGGYLIQEKMIEYTKAVLSNKQDKAVFFNFCLKITQECDCIAKDDPRIAPDIGILASCDPVAIDKASYDLVVAACKKDVFKQAHPKWDGTRQLKYAFELGLGNLDYELINLS